MFIHILDLFFWMDCILYALRRDGDVTFGRHSSYAFVRHLDWNRGMA
jgi:hypothetical protein